MEPETLSTLIGGGIGLLGAMAGLWVMAAMTFGSFSRWLATRPSPEIAPVPAPVLLERLLNLDDPRQPFRYVQDGLSAVRGEWRIADSSWWGILNRNKLNVGYRVRIHLQDRHREARVFEEWWRVRWVAGLNGPQPQVNYQRSFFRGVVLFRRDWERAYAFRELAPPNWGEVVNYDFDVWRIKGPILRTVVEAGWTFCPVALERHLEAQRPLT